MATTSFTSEDHDAGSLPREGPDGTWSVRRATPGDLPTVRALAARDLFILDHHSIYPTENWCQRVSEQGLLLLLTRKTQLVAVLGLVPVTYRDGSYHERCLWLCRRSYRGRGWGQLLSEMGDHLAHQIWDSRPIRMPTTDVYLVPISPAWAADAGLGIITSPPATGLGLRTARHGQSDQILRALARQLASVETAPRMDDEFYVRYLRTKKDVQATYVRQQGETVTDMASISYLSSTHQGTGEVSRIAVLRYHYATSVSLGHLLDTLLHYLHLDGVAALVFPETDYHSQVSLSGCRLGLQLSTSSVYPLC